MKASEIFTKALNRIGLYTGRQMSEAQDEIRGFAEYSKELEESLKSGPSDGKKILIFGENVAIHNLLLEEDQQVIIGRSSRNVVIFHARFVPRGAFAESQVES